MLFSNYFDFIATILQQNNYNFVKKTTTTKEENHKMATFRKFTRKNGKATYTATIRIKGYPTINQTFDRLTDAKKWAYDNESKMRTGRYINDNEAKKHTLAELIDRYIVYELPKRKEQDRQKYNMQLDWWKKHLGKYLLSNISPALLSEHKELLCTEKATKPQKGNETRSGATANRYMAALSAVFTIAVQEWGWMEDNPMRKVRKYKEYENFVRFLSEEEIPLLLDACKNFQLDGENYNNETYLFVLIALSTGARYSEIHKLKWENVDLKNKMFYFLQTKNGENRGVPMTETVYNKLKKFEKIRNINSNYLWTTKDGKKLIDMRVRFYKVLELSGIKNFRFHDLRHTVASHIAMNGGSPLDIAQVTGHKSMKMVQRYTHLTQKYTAKVLENTSNEMFSQTKFNEVE